MVDGGGLENLRQASFWSGQATATPFAPRTIKDLIEEALFARRRDLFSRLDLVFFDTTSFYFHGAGGETIGRYGHSRDHRPDLKQMVVGLVLDGEGRVVCSELWPGNTTDVTTLIPIVDCQSRFETGPKGRREIGPLGTDKSDRLEARRASQGRCNRLA